MLCFWLEARDRPSAAGASLAPEGDGHRDRRRLRPQLRA